MSYLVTAPLVLSHGRDGKTYHRYRGEVIEWLPDAQAEHFLTVGMVEMITSAEIVAITDAQARRRRQAEDAEAARVRQCVDVLNEIELPLTPGAPAARAAVRARGHRFGNDTIPDAVKQRRQLSRTATLPAWPETAEEPETSTLRSREVAEFLGHGVQMLSNQAHGPRIASRWTAPNPNC